MVTRLILIRHGQTDANRARRYCGGLNVWLNKKGVAQARRLCRKLKNSESIHALYVSDLRRTRQFASLVFPRLSPRIMPELREMHFGIFEGLRYPFIKKQYPHIYNKGIADPLKVCIPRAERLQAVARRVRRAVRAIIAANKGKTAVIVSHAGPLSIIMCDAAGKKLKDIWQMKHNESALSIIECDNATMRVIVFNDTSHLEKKGKS